MKPTMFRILQETNKGEQPTGGSGNTPTNVDTNPAAGGESPPSAVKGDEFDFAALALDDDSPAPEAKSPPGEAPAPKPAEPAKPATPAAPAAPVAAPAVPAGQAPTPQQPPAATEPAAVAPPAPAVPQPPAAAAPEQMSFEKHRAEFLPKLRDLYKNFTPEQVEKLRTEPETILPEMAANLHYEVQLATYNSVMSVLPNIIGMMMNQRADADKYETEFYGMHPKLKAAVGTDKEKEKVIQSSIKAYRAANPNATTQEIMQQAGLLAMMSLKIPLVDAPPPAPAGTPPAAARPSPPPRPPGIGASGAPMPRQPGGGDEGNIFEDLANDFLQEG